MSSLLDGKPFGPRDDAAFLDQINALTHWHWDHCAAYRLMWPNWKPTDSLADVAFVHVSIFKQLLLKTEGPGIVHQRTLNSSSTSGGAPSRIVLDEQSSALQVRSSSAILADLLGAKKRPLLILEDAKALRSRSEVSARVAAALSLRPMATDIQFLLDDSEDPNHVRWDVVRTVLEDQDDIIIYGFTWILWLAWGDADIPADVREKLASTRIHFVHSGGWKKLESRSIDREQFDTALLDSCAKGSRVVDYYGLVEQVGVVFPLCENGVRHVPRWATVLVRDPWTLESKLDAAGLLQFMNVLARGAPYHSVLTEDLGRVMAEPCSCGRHGPVFEFLGRVPKAEVRGCANV